MQLKHEVIHKSHNLVLYQYYFILVICSTYVSVSNYCRSFTAVLCHWLDCSGEQFKFNNIGGSHPTRLCKVDRFSSLKDISEQIIFFMTDCKFHAHHEVKMIYSRFVSSLEFITMPPDQQFRSLDNNSINLPS